MGERNLTVLDANWTPPVVYDITTDQQRVATQLDVDTLMSIAKQYGGVVSQIRQILLDHERFQEFLKSLTTIPK